MYRPCLHGSMSPDSLAGSYVSVTIIYSYVHQLGYHPLNSLLEISSVAIAGMMHVVTMTVIDI